MTQGLDTAQQPSGSSQEGNLSSQQAAVVGGPGVATDGQTGNPSGTGAGLHAQGATTQGQEAGASHSSSSAPVILGNMKFNSMEELARYTAQLQGRSEVIDKLQQITNPQPQVAVDPDAEIADLLFEDPKAAIKVISDRAQQKAKQEMEQSRQHDRAWDEFYKANPDLREHEDFVQFVLNKNLETIKSMDLSQAIAHVSHETRARLAKVRGSASSGQPLPSKPAVVAGSSGASLPQQPAQKVAPKSFIAQLSAYQRRGKGA